MSEDAKVQAYNRARLRLGLASTALTPLALVALLATGGNRGLETLAAQRVRRTTNVEVIFVFLLWLGLEILEMPLALLSRRLEQAYGLGRQSLLGWLGDQAKSWLIGIVLLEAAVVGVYWAIRRFPGSWWLLAWAVTTAFVVLMVGLAPTLLMPLFYKFRKMDPEDPHEGALVRRLLERYEVLRRSHRLPDLHGVYEWKLGEKSAKVNAALTGLGKSRRVILSDTLIADATPQEIEAVFAHEVGHHARRHIPMLVASQSGLLLLGFWLCSLSLRAAAGHVGIATPDDIAGLPLLGLVLALVTVVLLPAANAFSRRLERQADDYSFAAMGSAEPLLAGLRRLAQKNLAEVEPARWKEVLLYSHPAIGTRIRRGEAWQRRQGGICNESAGPGSYPSC